MREMPRPPIRLSARSHARIFRILIYIPAFKPTSTEITKDTPPTFMLAADNDKGPSTAIPSLYLSLKKAGVPTEDPYL